MSTTAKWVIGIVVGLVVLFALPFVWQALFPTYGYGMMGYGHMPMMGGYGYSGFTPFHGALPFMMIFMWLIPLDLVVLIVLGVAALVKYLTRKPESSN